MTNLVVKQYIDFNFKEMNYCLGTIYAINGPVIKVRGNSDLKMREMVLVGHTHLIGEVIGVDEQEAIVQVYESTTGIKPGEPVESSGQPMSVTLGPGILGNIFDGIARPLKDIEAQSGFFIERGIQAESINTDRQWNFTIKVKKGEQLKSGDVYATTQETPALLHKCMIPPGINGTIINVVKSGSYKVTDTLLKLRDHEGNTMDIKPMQKWSIRTPRPFKTRLPINQPLITGQRIIDTLYPIAKGGTAAVPGGFGTGKTMTQHQLAKWSDADIIVYIGCGERGNEMTQVLEDFSELTDPRTGRQLLDRTVLIANTSNMPVAAREASIYTGISLAEYYRDMGYHVAIMADSTSRWAEALREISGRLEEMPAEEGFPAYLASRLSEFYERAGYVINNNETEGSVTIIGAVSPQGGDFSEPVTQNTKRYIRCFWALDRALAYARHYPAIHWLTSYSEYCEELHFWYEENVSPSFLKYRGRMLGILQDESGLMEIVKLIGSDVLSDEQKLTLELARVIRLGFLQQNAYHADDTYVPLRKQFAMTGIIVYLQKMCKKLLVDSVPVEDIKSTGLFEKIIAMKYEIPNNKIELTNRYREEIDSVYEKLSR